MCVGNPQGGDADIGANAGHGRPSEPHHNALPPLPTAPPDHAIPNCLPNPMDPDENDVGPYSVEETPAKLPRQQVRARARKRNRGNDDSNATFMNDAGDGHLPAHVENDIADLGKLISLMQPGDIARAHEFGPTLEEYAVHGVPVDCGADWSRETIDAAIERGPHPSARTPESLELFRDDIKYQVNAGFAKIFLWEDIKDNLPSNLKISPTAVVPQENRRGRIILDLSFAVRLGREVIQQAVNASTAETTHPASQTYLGSSMERILKFLAHAPSEYPIYFSKYDVSDGFWRMVVAPGEEWNFAYVLPQEEGEPTRIVVPSSIQMGWKNSPGYFCSASETARDVAAEFAGFNGTMHDLPMHKMEHLIKRPTPDLNQPTKDASSAIPWAAIEVFVDDFVAMCQDVPRLEHLTRSILHGVEQVFPGPDSTGHKGGKESISAKKVGQGDADWTRLKEVLGWLVDGDNRTVQLTESKAAAYTAELRKLIRKRRIPIARYRKIIGKLRFASLCLPAGRALMTPLNYALRGDPNFVGCGKNSEVRESLGDWLQLLLDLARRPTSVHEIVAKAVDYYGYSDACKTGAAGVWLPLDSELEPFVWRVKWPADIVRRLGIYDGISISDAEGAGVLLQQMALEFVVQDLRHKKAIAFCDNTPAVSWVTRMASKRSRVGGRIAKGIAVRARNRHMCLPEALSVPGDANKMADVGSRSFSAESGFLFSNAELLSYFSTHFSLPQNRSWRVVTLPPADISKVVSTLRGQRLTMAQWTSRDDRNIGTSGLNSQPPAGGPPPTLTTALKSVKPPSSAPLLSGSGTETTDSAVESLRKRWTEQSEPWGRPSSWLAGKTQQRSMAAVSASFNSAASSHRIGEPTRPRSPN